MSIENEAQEAAKNAVDRETDYIYYLRNSSKEDIYNECLNCFGSDNKEFKDRLADKEKYDKLTEEEISEKLNNLYEQVYQKSKLVSVGSISNCYEVKEVLDMTEDDLLYRKNILGELKSNIENIDNCIDDLNLSSIVIEFAMGAEPTNYKAYLNYIKRWSETSISTFSYLLGIISTSFDCNNIDDFLRNKIGENE